MVAVEVVDVTSRPSSCYYGYLPDITQINQGNDLDTAYPLLDVSSRLPGSPWFGGLNLTAVEMLEQRSYGWFWYMRNNSINPDFADRFVLNLTVSGTQTGLSKFPYLRCVLHCIASSGVCMCCVGLDPRRSVLPQRHAAVSGGTGRVPTHVSAAGLLERLQPSSWVSVRRRCSARQLQR